MKTIKRFFVVVTHTIFGGILLTTVAQAGEMPMKGKYVNLKPESNCTKIQDVEGHVICTFELPGVGIRDDGEYYTRSVKGTIDYIKGVGNNQGYTISTFADGSTITVQWEGNSKFNDQKIRVSEGSYNCLTGTGRFTSIKCNGTWSSTAQKGGFTLGGYEGTMTLPD